MNRSRKIFALMLLLIIFYYPGAYGQNPGRIEAEKIFVEAQKALARGDDATAEQQLMQSLQHDPSFTSAIWQLSQIYEKRGQLEYARELILRGLQQDPNAAWARDKLSQVEKLLVNRLKIESEAFMDSGHYDKALPKLSLYVGIRPHDPDPLILLGRCHLALGNLKTAREYLVQAIQRDPTSRSTANLLDEVDQRISLSSAETALARARTILANYTPENREKAENALRDLLEKDPGNSWAAEKLKELTLLSRKDEKTSEPIEAIEKGVDKIKSISLPQPGKFLSPLRSRITIALLAVIIVLLSFNIRRRSRIRSYPLQGSLSLIPVLDIVSLLNSNLKSGRLAISSGKLRGEIFFEKGEIVHSRYKSYDGKNAFHRLMDINSGSFIFYNHLPNVRHTITEPLSLLLLSMKSIDEESTARKKERTLSPV
ncbi:MAG: tetratricopeptide repeat protein [Candidatus Krumholzibacteriota bacterium]|nr:tetratricopeptide repeat protein [Candidatus Krumholzibacteriota bacterium]